MVVLLLAGLTLAVTGCPPTEEPGTAQVTTLIQVSSAKQGNSDVPMSDIESFIVTVTEIEMVSVASVASEESEVLFTGEVDVDLRDLTDLAAVVSNEEIPAGDYTQTRISIENPRLVLVDEPDVVRTDIQLTANGRLFVTERVTIPEGNNLIVLDFADLKLVQQGNGSFTLTPQLDVDVSVTSADVVVSGTIASVDLDNESLVLTLPSGEVDVALGEADIFIGLEAELPEGLLTDLAVGLEVEIHGVLFLDGSIAADAVYIL
jgi:hypothetical protein